MLYRVYNGAAGDGGRGKGKVSEDPLVEAQKYFCGALAVIVVIIGVGVWSIYFRRRHQSSLPLWIRWPFHYLKNHP